GSGEIAHGYFPGNYPEAGDVWFSSLAWPQSEPISPGSLDYLAALHEIGHALGLKHPFDGSAVLSAALDNFSYTVMSYSPHAGVQLDVTASFYPTTPMYLDLVAIQKLYGVTSVNAGNTTYTFHEGQNYWQTINDTGGTDTIVYASNTGGLINLGV